MLETEQYNQDVEAIKKAITEAGEALHVDHMREQIEELTQELNQPESTRSSATSSRGWSTTKSCSPPRTTSRS